MDKIEFQNNQYKVREIELPELGNVLISTITLNQLLLNEDGSYVSEEAISVDESIYFFVDEYEIKLSDDELINLLTKEVK
ncbi:hypothetical protein [Flavobacterium filum]|uniref:hypothetical protein n=1 Tax=Flavobacterium TaxID=237 RepID=UPI000404756E|nr:hypothetical protein [Flavobacterium filum]